MTLYHAIAVKAAMVMYMLGEGRICSPVIPLSDSILGDSGYRFCQGDEARGMRLTFALIDSVG